MDNKTSFNSPSQIDIQHFTSIVGQQNLITDPALCSVYGYDNSKKQGQPSLVLFPTDHDHIASILKYCAEHRLPLITRGRGTGTTGAVVPEFSEVILSTERLRNTLSIDCENRIATVEPGFTNGELQQALNEKGFFWPPDPTSRDFCSIGGNLAYNSAGPSAVKYGTPRENTLSLTVVTGTGHTLKTGTYTTKGVVGYDLTRLFIGSEGTLGVITSAALKLTPLPAAVATMQVFYNSIETAAQAISNIMAQAATPSALEFLDSSALDLVRGFSDVPIPQNAKALLMVEVDGPQVSLDHQCKAIQKAAHNEGLISFGSETQAQARKKLWAVRSALSPAQRKIAPKKINEDVVVPVSKIPDLIKGLEQLSQKFGIPIVNFGHAGNGNIHVNLLVDMENPTHAKNAYPCLDEVFSLVLDLNGTLSGEHGIGMEKREYISRELSPYSLELMRQIKQIFDPHNILNPGKSFPLQR